MPFSLSGGLSAMGKSVADTAGDMMLNTQRAELERQRLALAETLAEGRESRGREQAGMINAAAAEKEQTFRATENEKNRAKEFDLANLREEGDDRRAKMSNARIMASESATQKRFDAEMELKVKEAKERATDKAEQRVLNSVIAAATTTVEQPYTTADGEKATRPVKMFDPVKAAGILRDTGHENLAAPFFPKPKAVKATTVNGKPKPPLESFLNGN